jgi:uncharacterized integral membrane protein
VSNSDDHHLEARDVGRVVRLLIIAAIVVVIVLVAVDNRDDVRVGWVIGDSEAPLWIVLVLAAVAGVVIGWLMKHRPRRHH